jgi:hypothetical protein
MKIREFIIMPQTIKPMGLIHKPGTGPNNRFDFRNKGNNRGNEDAAGVGIITKQNTTADVRPGETEKNLKKLQLASVKENFADGKGPGRPGDSKRAGIPKKATIAQLKKIRGSNTASPRKKQLAHWQINMRQGRKK